MPLQKFQMHRLMRIASLLKGNRYPNSETLVKEFRRIALEEDLEIDCGKKTILRDMKVLEEEFHCPLAFDRARNGYYLRHHGWDFIAPALLDENEMLAAVIGARISEEIFPAPLKKQDPQCSGLSASKQQSRFSGYCQYGKSEHSFRSAYQFGIRHFHDDLSGMADSSLCEY